MKKPGPRVFVSLAGEGPGRGEKIRTSGPRLPKTGHDLGVDVPPEKFVQAIQEVKPEVVGLSGFLTLAFDQMRVTIEGIKEAGLRDSVKIMIGGAIMDDSAAQYIGADAYGPDATAAVKLAKSWTGGN